MEKHRHFFKLLHNETGPTGYLGQGTHYSIVRLAVWHNEALEPTPTARLLDIGIIWDQSRDRHVLNTLEKLYVQGLLSPAVFIAERKRSVILLIPEETLKANGEKWMDDYHTRIEKITHEHNDTWPAEVVTVNSESRIIDDDRSKVQQYLNNLMMLWQLGLKKV